MSDIDFSQVKGVRIPQGEVKFIVGSKGEEGTSEELLWRRPPEFPYVIGACTITNSGGHEYEHFSHVYIEKYQEPVAVNAAYLPTYNANINVVPAGVLQATSSLVGATLNGYYCNNETDCLNLHIPSKRNKIKSYYSSAYWGSSDGLKGKILAYASKEGQAFTAFSQFHSRLEGVPTFQIYNYTKSLPAITGFHVPYGEYATPDLCRVLDTSTPMVSISKSNLYTDRISAVREDYSDLVAQYDTVTSGAYPKSEYPYIDFVTELGLGRYIPNSGIANQGTHVFAFYVFARVSR